MRNYSSRSFRLPEFLSGLLTLTVATPLLAAASEQQPPLFEVLPTSQTGITWKHENAMSEHRYLPETAGPGAAFLDYDNDGRMDIYLVNSGPADIFQPATPLRNALYRNNRDGTFSDVTESAGVEGGMFGMGAAAADYDADGDTDLFVTAYGAPILYANQGDGTFRDVTEQSGIDTRQWTTSAVWFDADNDGHLDLFVCGFVRFSADLHVSCGLNPRGQAYYCIPRVFDPMPSLLYRNRGDGTFQLVSPGTAIEQAKGKAFGVVATDVNNDRWMDLFVANDTVANFLFINRGGLRWEEAGLFSQVGHSVNGDVRSGMGVDAGDFNGDGLADLFVANVDQETYSLYLNLGDETFRDEARRHDIADSTLLLSGWGLKFFDYDNDGDQDLLLANGHPDDMIAEYTPRVTYEEPLLLYRNEKGRLENISSTAGPAFSLQLPARGLAVGDIDNDGAIDVLVANNGQAPVLLHNRAARGHHWIGLRLQGVRANREAVGARLRWSVGGRVRERLKNSGGSYLSSHDPREVIGLGSAERLDWLEISWPSPSTLVERFESPPLDRYLLAVEGSGKLVAWNDLPGRR